VADGTWLVFPNAPEPSVNSSAFLGSPEARKRGYQAPAWSEADVVDAGKRFLTLTVYARWATLASESVSRTRRGHFISSRSAWCYERLAFFSAPH
jgi:hypothetical protein